MKIKKFLGGPRTDVCRIHCEEQLDVFTGLLLGKLTYEIAHRNVITIPQKWHDTELADVEWLYYFRKRYPVFSLSALEACR